MRLILVCVYAVIDGGAATSRTYEITRKRVVADDEVEATAAQLGYARRQMVDPSDRPVLGCCRPREDVCGMANFYAVVWPTPRKSKTNGLKIGNAPSVLGRRAR